MGPLTLTDAKHPATVAKWLNTWLTSGQADRDLSTCLVRGPKDSRLVLRVSLIDRGPQSGLLATSTVWSTPERITHADSAALVAYVVAWARGIN